MSFCGLLCEATYQDYIVKEVENCPALCDLPSTPFLHLVQGSIVDPIMATSIVMLGNLYPSERCWWTSVDAVHQLVNGMTCG